MTDSIKTKSIECESITIKHPDGEGSIQLMATPNGVGIWLVKNGNRKSPMISIYSFDNQTAIGITSDKLVNSNKAYQLALSVNERTHEPSIQIITDDDELIILSSNDLAEIAKKHVYK